MRTELTAMIAAMTILAALPAAAEMATPAVAHDRLLNQIMSKELTEPAGGRTGSVRLGSGQAITLNLVDPLAPLRPAAGLAEKTAKAKARRKLPRADEQLKKMSQDERRADWAGRK